MNGLVKTLTDQASRSDGCVNKYAASQQPRSDCSTDEARRRSRWRHGRTPRLTHGQQRTGQCLQASRGQQRLDSLGQSRKSCALGERQPDHPLGDQAAAAPILRSQASCNQHGPAPQSLPASPAEPDRPGGRPTRTHQAPAPRSRVHGYRSASSRPPRRTPHGAAPVAPCRQTHC